MSAEQAKSPEVLALEEQLACLQFKFNNLVVHAKGQDSRIAEQDARLHQITLYQDGVTWHWQGDGEDYPESLTCPVVIPANALRELMVTGNVKRQLMALAAPASPLLEKAGRLQVVGRAYQDGQRAILNSAGLALPDGTALYAGAGDGSILAILSERDGALNKADQLAGMVVAAEELLREAYNGGKLQYHLMSKLEAYFARRAAGRPAADNS